MATSQNQGFIEQLREMRNTRTQQLRQGNQQSSLLTRQITAMTTLNKTMESVLRAQSSSNATLKNISTSQTNVSRQTEQMSKSINNLSTSITRSMGSVASAVGRGASGAASAVGSAGGSVMGAASSVASGVASSLAKVLPFAIAGIVGKMMVYDKMDDSVKKDLTDSFGNLVESIFGSIDTSGLKKVTAPIAKELGIVFGALGDTLEAVTSRISGLVKKLPTGVEKVGDAVEKVGNAIKKPPAEARAAIKMVKQVGDVVKGVATGTSLPEYETVKTGVAAVGTVAATVGAVAVGKKAFGAPTSAVATSPAAVISSPAGATMYKPNQFASWQDKPANKEAVKEITKKGDKVTKAALVGARLFGKLSLAGGKYMVELGKLVVQTKFGGFFGWAGILVQAGVWWYVQSVLDEMAPEPMGDGTLTKEEYYALTKQAAEYALVVGATSSLGSGLGVGGALVLGRGRPSKALSLGMGFGGSVAGTMFGEALLSSNKSLPESLTSELGVSNNNSALTTATSARDAREARNERPGAAKPQGAINPSPASSSSSNVGFERFKGAIGRAETESEPDPYRARNRAGSSASGKYQVIKDTFERYSKIKGSPVYGMTFEEFQNSSPEIQEALMDYMLQDYNRILTAGKVPINEKTLYLAHFLGPETAVKVYNADPNDPLSKYITKNGQYDLMIKQNPGLVTEGTTTMGIQLALGKRVSSRMAGNRGNTTSVASSASASPASASSFASADPNTATTSTSYEENYARRSKEAKEAEKYEEGSDSFVGPTMAESKKTKPSVLSAFASQFSIESFTSDFADRTKQITDVVDSMFTSQNQSKEPVVIADNSNVTNVINSSAGGGGAPSINQIVSNHMSNMNWQFNSISGGVRA